MPTPEEYARVETIEAKLKELDPILLRFCSQHGFTLYGREPLYPRRRLTRIDDVGRSLDLTSDLSVPEIMEKGFFPEMTWSLHAYAALRPASLEPTRIMTIAIFEHLPFSDLPEILAGKLAEGEAILRTLTANDIIEKGERR